MIEALQKLLKDFRQKIVAYLRYKTFENLTKKFNEMLTNDTVKFEQAGPCHSFD